jgi:hypothetical protein
MAHKSVDDERPQFERERIAAIPKEWERAKWLVEREQSINDREKGLGDFQVRRLYSEARASYILGVYGATIWASLAAVERLLRSRLKTGEYEKFAPLTERAEAAKLISAERGATLRELWELLRNPVVHGKEQFAFGLLGTRKKDEGYFEVVEGKSGYHDISVAAHDAIETFLRVIDEAPPREKN